MSDRHRSLTTTSLNGVLLLTSFCGLVGPDQTWPEQTVLVTTGSCFTERWEWANLSAVGRQGRWWQTPVSSPFRRCSRPSAWRWRPPAPRGSRRIRCRHTWVQSSGRWSALSWSSQEDQSSRCRLHHTCWKIERIYLMTLYQNWLKLQGFTNRKWTHDFTGIPRLVINHFYDKQQGCDLSSTSPPRGGESQSLHLLFCFSMLTSLPTWVLTEMGSSFTAHVHTYVYD